MGASELVRSEHQLAPPVGRRGPLGAFLTATRPKQWIKNLLVFLAPAAAGALGHPVTVLRAGAAGLVFIVASSGSYLINDVNDVQADRAHPTKRNRPIAAGEIPVRAALVFGSGFVAVSVVFAWLLAGGALALCIASYVVITTAYSLWLKRVPYLELVVVSSGFVLRAVAGGIAVHVVISPWFLLVTSTCAVLIATGKRTAEMLVLKDQGVVHRSVISSYSITKLFLTRMVVSATAAVGYGLWAFSQSARSDSLHGSLSDLLYFKLSIIPFLLGLAVLERALERGEGGEPEELALRSRALQLAGLCCVGLVAAGIYL